MLDITCS